MNNICNSLNKCVLCPRNCGVNRVLGNTAYCGSNAEFNISSIVVHKGEEPVISGVNGICNIFFSRCNMQCVYCQNNQISCNRGEVISKVYTLDEVVNEIISIFEQNKINSLGFVSPSHYVPHVIAIIENLKIKGYNPITVYNTNSYDKVETLKLLEDYINIYLPDFKYSDNLLSKNLSDANNYFEIASAAIKEMYRQKGNSLLINENGLLESGLIIRHLVLPGEIENSLKILRYIADEISPNISISLMSQYHPATYIIKHPELNRKLTVEEYEKVVNELEILGMYNGWIQELDSSDFYLPDFENKNPFCK